MTFASLLTVRARLCVVLGIFLLGGCATGAHNPDDPLEPLNRAVYKFNDGFDRVLLKPAATVYQTVLPQFVRTGVTNFFNNLYDILVALNNLLQGKLPQAVSDVGRVAVNTTVGIGGLFDVGTKIGLQKHDEDFGQTLGVWGIHDGPYLQLPFFGPSSFRDALGLAVDYKGDPVRWLWNHDVPTRNSLWGLNLVNKRANLLNTTDLLEQAALDPYEYQRDAYLQNRRSKVYDGNPPPDKQSELDDQDSQQKPAAATIAPVEKGAAASTDAPAIQSVLLPSSLSSTAQ